MQPAFLLVIKLILLLENILINVHNFVIIKFAHSKNRIQAKDF